jgi:hypothetical protein
MPALRFGVAPSHSFVLFVPLVVQSLRCGPFAVTALGYWKRRAGGWQGGLVLLFSKSASR